MTKLTFLHWAEIVDSYRVVPRILIFVMLIWMIHVVDWTLLWYMKLPMEAQSIQTSGLAAAIVTAVTGLWTLVFKIYSSTGRDWNAQPISTTTTTVATATTVPP